MITLRAEVEDLEAHLTRNVLEIYHLEGRCDQFLDCYLLMVQQLLECSGALPWSSYAAECARKCNRVEELAGALRHEIRFHPHSPQTKALQMELEELEVRRLTTSVVREP
jgi:hypothetical protein